MHDLKDFCILSGQDFTQVFNDDINDNFISETIKYLEKGTGKACFFNSDLFFYQASDYLKTILDLPSRPKPPKWVSDFIQAHAFFEEWQGIGNPTVIECNFLWRMEIHEKIIMPLNKLRTKAFFAPLLFRACP